MLRIIIGLIILMLSLILFFITKELLVLIISICAIMLILDF